jgi:hypothetical protein
MRRYLWLILFLLGACAHATSFEGKAQIEGGRASCQQKCGLQGLQMSALVYMGEYSSACVCEIPGNNGPTARRATSAATTAAAVGVITQTRNAESAVASTVATMIILGTLTGAGVGAGG